MYKGIVHQYKTSLWCEFIIIKFPPMSGKNRCIIRSTRRVKNATESTPVSTTISTLWVEDCEHLFAGPMAVVSDQSLINPAIISLPRLIPLPFARDSRYCPPTMRRTLPCHFSEARLSSSCSSMRTTHTAGVGKLSSHLRRSAKRSGQVLANSHQWL